MLVMLEVFQQKLQPERPFSGAKDSPLPELCEMKAQRPVHECRMLVGGDRCPEAASEAGEMNPTADSACLSRVFFHTFAWEMIQTVP